MFVFYCPKRKAYLDLFIQFYHCILKILTARILIICSSLLFGKINPKGFKKRVLTNKKVEGGVDMLYFEDVNKTF